MKLLKILLIIAVVGLTCSAAKPLDPKRKLSVTSYNILGFGHTRSNWQETINFIKARSTDLLLMQEYTTFFHSKLRRALKKIYPYSHINKSGLAMFSKHPLSRAKYIRKRTRRNAAQCATMKWNKKQIGVCNVHFQSPAVAMNGKGDFTAKYEKNVNQRRNEWEAVVDWCKRFRQTGFIIAGDYNTSELEELAVADDKVTDVMDEMHTFPGPTWPHVNDYDMPFPVFRIDYIFRDDSFRTITADTLTAGGSDHLPIQAELYLK